MAVGSVINGKKKTMLHREFVFSYLVLVAFCEQTAILLYSYLLKGRDGCFPVGLAGKSQIFKKGKVILVLETSGFLKNMCFVSLEIWLFYSCQLIQSFS